MSYLEDGSGTGSFVGADLNPDDIEYNRHYSSDSDSSSNPAGQYLDHSLQVADIALNVTLPDLVELADSARYGHFADYYATSHCAVEETGGWGPAIEEAPVEMPSFEAQAMHEL